MKREQRDYAEIYRSRTWAYSDKPDPELIKALVGFPRGRAVDLGGGQGRHAIALAALGFDVVLVDSVVEGLHQASATADERGLTVDVVHSDAADYESNEKVDLIVAALLFHIVPKRKSLRIAERCGQRLRPGGLIYISLPGYTTETVSFVRELLNASGCREEWLVKHLVTKKERPRLQVSRRNEVRALGRKPGGPRPRR
jgi:2-polyprenyl-3-methyl-5-hydroxy-6-metoxy-1,4-benzoquinol methylase